METLWARFSQRLTLNKSLLNKQKNDKKAGLGIKEQLEEEKLVFTMNKHRAHSTLRCHNELPTDS